MEFIGGLFSKFGGFLFDLFLATGCDHYLSILYQKNGHTAAIALAFVTAIVAATKTKADDQFLAKLMERLRLPFVKGKEK